ncbi:hypothetical protein HC931_20605 [Candidatus Gracilibacteria bacterium]|nr:hypothetical protein [Candidatus Gracilibacteria bacterium]NJM88855.1 hypothetical protein [Hydrococcus sp. RU_2_2]NJP22238.1 hypothetical protein [Hydrococcus sp. CRU_1_1]
MLEIDIPAAKLTLWRGILGSPRKLAHAWIAPAKVEVSSSYKAPSSSASYRCAESLLPTLR